MTDAPQVRENYHHLVRTDIAPFVPDHGGTLLDIGGGVGATAAYLKSLGKADRIGVADMVDSSASGVTKDFTFKGNLEDPAFIERIIAEEGPFSTILCLDVLEHLPDPWTIVARLHQALKPGGVIVASIPNVRHYTALLPLLFRNKWTYREAGILDRTHLRFFVKDTAVELMTSSGLKLELVKGNPQTARRMKLFRALTFNLFHSFTDLQYIVRVRRDD